ncbi:MAG TPA: NADH:ubiquinone reductase (Na(+)-transporting) subunit F [Candidatus Omnitrophota bacterium]|nr:NADH:ubiquinone reductase (Na(+)-transporting) subunit F [Candidatus Omnitrophota bacterium]
MAFVLLSAGVFSGIILLLIFLLTVVEAKVAAKGNATIAINEGGRSLKVPTGKSLLSTLAAQDIYLPSACGGKGSCAQCKCEVLQGGGDVLPTEVGFLSRREQKRGVRLACQVKVRQDMSLAIPEEILEIRKYQCKVRSNRNVATFIKELVLEMEEPLDFKPGGYIQIDIPQYSLSFRDFDIEKKFLPDWEKYELLDLKAENEDEIFRAYSMANHPAEKGLIILNVRIATPPPKDMSLPPGLASSYIFNLRPGDPVTISGPYGEFFIKDTQKEMIYVGGGAGMAPLRSHLFHMFHTMKMTDRKVSFWYGARSKREMFYEEDFRQIEKEFPNFKFHLALSEPLPEDNWKGPTGFIHQVLYEQYLKDHAEPEEIEYYMCGPPMMIAAVQTMLDSLGVPQDMIAFDDFGI